MKRILFVCLGNICRSPAAEGVLRARARERGMKIAIDSAGTGAYHVGETADPRTLDVLERHGIPYDGCARQVRVADFEDFDLILAMDDDNLQTIDRARPANGAKTALFDAHPVPDPYYTGDFEGALDQIEAAADRLIAQLQRLAASAPNRS